MDENNTPVPNYLDLAALKIQENNQIKDSFTNRSVNDSCNILINDGKKSNKTFIKKSITFSHAPKRCPVDISFKKLSYFVKVSKNENKIILKSLDGKFKSGKLTAIMGPSGSGKSSLMNILAGYRVTNIEGTVHINGKERNLRRFRKMSCYIMQNDCLTPLLTVREAMYMSAKLKLGKEISQKVKKNIIADILEALSLTECADTKTVSLSGGQRKRLSIALELVNNPPVMFFDEPTSGLDSSSCFQCICLLQSLARDGRTVICTIHQPSARLFEMFNHLYMLVDGNCMYNGEVGGLVPFLSSMGLQCPAYHNPADYLMEIACGDHGDCIADLVEVTRLGRCEKFSSKIQTDASKDLSDNITFDHNEEDAALIEDSLSCESSPLDPSENNITFPTSTFQQFRILLKRVFLSTLRDQYLTRLRLIAHTVVGFLLGILYFQIGNDASKVQSNTGCIFFIAFFTLFSSMMPTILTFPTERPVFIKEHLNYWYSVKSYYFAKTCSDIPFQMLMTLCFITVVYFMTSQPTDLIRFSMFLLINILTALNSQSIGLIVGTLFDVEGGTFCGPVSTIPLVLFSGYFVQLGDIPYFLKWLTYVSFMRFSFEGCLVAIYGMKRQKMVCNVDYCHFKYPEKFLEQMSVKGDFHTFVMDVAVLCFTFLLLRVALYFLLKRKIVANR